MAFMTTDDGTRLFYRLEGPDGAPPIILSNSLGTDHMMWQPQAEALGHAFRVVRYDQRGHGASDAPAGPYTFERLGLDVLALADHLGLERFSFCGLSMGGRTGQWLAIHAGARLDQLVLASTAAEQHPREVWDQRIDTVAEKGLAGIVDLAIERFFSQDFRRTAPATVAEFCRTLLATSPQGYIGCCQAVRDTDFRREIASISVPTLVFSGAVDPGTPPECGAFIAEAIIGARLVILEGSHIINVEQPDAFNRELLRHLGQDGLPTDTPFQTGMARRRQVLGPAWVERSIAKRNPFNADFQDLITRYAWGEIWTRPGLEEETRRLIVLAITAALGRWEEFDLHGRAALEAGVSPDRIKELLLQTAIYAGVPAANTAFQRMSGLM
ncbi:MAG TPA: 3-oxoadipate enol-lactonase, partial [Aestuariivirgaceae bacterium]|nr:3-oxoadipate enol-lactonase [Aestuariivirgaceae bacterium]